MRELTKKQKAILDKWYNENKEEIQTGLVFFDWSKCDLFPLSLFEELESINDTEVLNQNVNRYISEK